MCWSDNVLSILFSKVSLYVFLSLLSSLFISLTTHPFNKTVYFAFLGWWYPWFVVFFTRAIQPNKAATEYKSLALLFILTHTRFPEEWCGVGFIIYHHFLLTEATKSTFGQWAGTWMELRWVKWHWPLLSAETLQTCQSSPSINTDALRIPAGKSGFSSDLGIVRV